MYEQKFNTLNYVFHCYLTEKHLERILYFPFLHIHIASLIISE